MTEKERLEELIAKYDRQYWDGEETEVSDQEYDKLVRRLAELDPDNILVTRIDTAPIKKKVVHEKPMLSLAKAYSLDEVLKWCKKVARSDEEVFKIQPKYDGLSGLLDKNGVLSSRGDGKIGEDYSDKLPFIKFYGSPRADGTWLGEILISDEDFRWMQTAEVKGKSGNVFKNQRNAVAGIVGADDIEFYKDVASKMEAAGKSMLSFVDYEWHSWHVELREIQEKWEEVKSLVLKSGMPMDGIVIKLADEKYAESLGFTEHHPKGALAFKFTNQNAWSVLRSVQWSMGKDQIAAIGCIDPVDISGTTIKNVKLQLTKPVASDVKTWLLDGSLQLNDEVLVERAGDIIPHIIESRPGKDRKRVHLDFCPFCAAPLQIDDTSVKCTNTTCPKKIVEKLKFAMLTLGFKGVGDSYATSLFDKLDVSSVYQLMTVKETDLRKHREFGDKMVSIFIREQQKALKEAGALKALIAMDIPSIGKFVGNALLEAFSLDRILAGDITEEEMLKVKGIGSVAAAEASRGLRDRNEEVRKTIALFDIGEPAPKSGSTGARGKICFTGKMEHKRAELQFMACSIGFEPVESMGAGVLLVCADPDSGSAKMQKAKKLGCKVISEAEFLEMMK